MYRRLNMDELAPGVSFNFEKSIEIFEFHRTPFHHAK